MSHSLFRVCQVPSSLMMFAINRNSRQTPNASLPVGISKTATVPEVSHCIQCHLDADGDDHLVEGGEAAEAVEGFVNATKSPPRLSKPAALHMIVNRNWFASGP